MHAHRVVVASVVERASSSGILPAPQVPLLSGVLGDFLQQLITFEESRLDHNEVMERLTERLEHDVLGGAVRVKRRRALGALYPMFSYRPVGWKGDLPLMNASSMVSELAPVVLYLRHLVRPGDVLIIEEPESHLHPAMQVALIRRLAEAVRAGVRVIMTTHSEWVLEELANLVRLSHVAESRRVEIDEFEFALRSQDVGAWLFVPKRRPRGSTIKEIRLDVESGAFPVGFSEVAAALHNKWAEISSLIEEDERQ